MGVTMIFKKIYSKIIFILLSASIVGCTSFDSDLDLTGESNDLSQMFQSMGNATPEAQKIVNAYVHLLKNGSCPKYNNRYWFCGFTQDEHQRYLKAFPEIIGDLDTYGYSIYYLCVEAVKIGIQNLDVQGCSPESLDIPVDIPDKSPPVDPGSPVEKVKLGILGDSDSDEYQADDARGGTYREYTLNWAEQHVLAGLVDLGPWGCWGRPRRSGYERNWARTGATSASMISERQHEGLAAQVAAGEVTHVIIKIGANDLKFGNGTYQEIYNGSLSEAQLQRKIQIIINSMTVAVDTLLAAGNPEILIVDFSEKVLSAKKLQEFPNASGRQRVGNTVAAVNAGYRQISSQPHVYLWRHNYLLQELIPYIDATGKLLIEGEAIDMLKNGNDPHFLALRDTHLGTVGGGLIGNSFFDLFRRAGVLEMDSLSNQMILEFAGIR
jgi:hypothetical protein